MFGLFKGLSAPVLGVSAQNALMFGIQRKLLKYVTKDRVGHFYSGCIVGAIQSIIYSPIDFAKIQLQVQGIGEKIKSKKERYFKGPIDVLRTFYKTDGLRAGFYRGFSMTLIRDCPGYGIYFYSYVYFCDMLTPKHHIDRHTIGPMQLLMAGGLCGMLSWGIIYPLDVIKTRIQVDGFMPHGKYKNHIHCLTHCYHNEGLTVFTRGLGTTILRAFPVNAATLCTITLVERLLNSYRNDIK